MQSPSEARSNPWWKRGVVYQIYPRSFQDSNGDGVGDLPGILSRLDYLASLGIDAIWISPIFPSPMADFGYDVADYCGIHPLFGTLEDFDRLLEAAHERGLKVLLDLVPNHTSDQHPWFLEALEGGEKEDWYLWRDPAPDGGPPNNWKAYFGGPAWTYVESKKKYYLHQFLPEQPDLNHRNPEVRAAIQDAMRFWLKRGVDGFRVDVIALMIKHPDFPDDPINPNYRPGIDLPTDEHLHLNRQNLPEVHDVIREMRAVVDEFSDRVMIGEIYLPPEKLCSYYGRDLDECHLPFNFGLIGLEDWSAAAIRAHVEDFEAHLPEGAWPNYVLGNHDRPRPASRVPEGQARLAQVLLLTLRGTPTAYYGDELGLEDVEIPREKWQDPSGLRQLDFALGSRDPERTPMPWDDGPNSGFCPEGQEPWLPLGSQAKTIHVQAQEKDPSSFLHFFRDLLKLRRSRPSLEVGRIQFLDLANSDLLAYQRDEGSERTLVVANFSSQAQAFSPPKDAKLLQSTHGATSDPKQLEPGEARVYDQARR